MPDQIVEVEKSTPVSIADIKKSLGIPETSSPVDFHDRVISKIVTKDCLDTLASLWQGVGVKSPDLNLLPANIFKILSEAANKAGGLDLLNSQHRDFSFEEAALIALESRANAEVFEQQGDRIRAAEARRIPAAFIESLVLEKLMGRTWGAIEHNGKTVGQWRTAYIKGTAANLNGYPSFVDAVDKVDPIPEAEKVINAFGNLQKLGVTSFSELFGVLGMDQEALAKQAEAAVDDFAKVKAVLDSKIQDLVTEGRIPDVAEVKKSYAAYASAASELDTGEQKKQPADPDEVLAEMAQKEDINVPEGSYKIYPNSKRPNAVSLIYGWVDETGHKETGVVLLLPERVTQRQIYHEGAHMLHIILIGNELNSVLLAGRLPRTKAELIATYASNKYGGPDTYFARLEAVRFALLNQAQSARMKDLDRACAEGNVENVAAILKEDPTSKAIAQTFGRAVMGEGRGLPLGSFGLYGSANTAGLEYVRKGIPMRTVIEEAVFA